MSDGSLSDTIAVTITVTDVNEAPAFPEGAPALDVDENTAAGVAFGDAVTATDPDGDTLTYSLSGSDASSFAIDENTGRLKTKSALDYEGENTRQVTVTASDGSLTDSVVVDVSVNDVGEPPGKPSAPDGVVERGDFTLGELVGACEHRAGHHRLRRAVQAQEQRRRLHLLRPHGNVDERDAHGPRL